MSEPWTPGPWTYQREVDAADALKFWSVSCDTPPHGTGHRGQRTRLIAAAPEMAALLQRMLDYDYWTAEDRAEVAAVLARIRGDA